MARCPECNRFVSLELNEEADVQNLDFDHITKTLTLELQLVRICSECGEEIQSASLNITKKVDFEIPEWVDEFSMSEPEPQLSFVETGGSKSENRFGAEGEVWVEAIWREAGKDQDSEWS